MIQHIDHSCDVYYSSVCAIAIIRPLSFSLSLSPYLFLAPDLSVDVMDVSGEHQLDVEKSIFRERLTLDGMKITEDEAADTKEEQEKKPPVDPSYCGSCYGADHNTNLNVCTCKCTITTVNIVDC